MAPRGANYNFHPPLSRDFESLKYANSRNVKFDNQSQLLTFPLFDEEHLLRSSSRSIDSFARRGHRARSSSIVTNPYEDPPNDDFHFRNNGRTRSVHQSKYSPTPSIKRGKAEKLLKEHGSPPGIRVTASGRIVPDGMTPITSPRFDIGGPFGWQRGNYNINAGRQNVYNIPGHISNPRDIEGGLMQVDNLGHSGQFLAGECRPVQHQNGLYQLYMQPSVVHQVPTLSGLEQFNGQQGLPPFQPMPVIELNADQNHDYGKSIPILKVEEIPTVQRIKEMEGHHSKLESDLKELDRNEVLQRDKINSATRLEIVNARINLTNRLDKSRRAIQEAKKAMKEKRPVSVPSQYACSTHAQVPTQPMVSSFIPVYNGQPMNALSSQRLDQKQYSASEYPMMHPICSTGIVPDQYQTYQATMPNVIEMSQMQNALQERVGNARFGMGNDMFQSNASLDTSRPHDGIVGTTLGSMNLDGSAHQPRRSHAIAIKSPREQHRKNSSALNPASPNYEPCQLKTCLTQQSSVRNVVTQFVPSAGPTIDSAHLTSSPYKHNAAGGDCTAELPQFQNSDSSASTGDFFPNNTFEFSSTKYMHPRHGSNSNLPAWMPKEGESGMSNEQTPKLQGRPRKYIWHDSPNGKFDFDSHWVDDKPDSRHPSDCQLLKGGSGTSTLIENNSYFDAKFVAQAAHCRPSSASTGKQNFHIRETTVTTDPAHSTPDNKSPLSHLLEQASDRAATISLTTPKKSRDYLEGFEHGVRQELSASNRDTEYRLGYRDGLLQSYLVAPTVPSSLANMGGIISSSAAAAEADQAVTPLRLRHGRNVSLSRVPSCPSLFQPTRVPVNSLSSTPKTSDKPNNGASPMNLKPLESPRTVVDFMSKPNVNLSNSHNLGDRRLTKVHEPISPSPNHPISSHGADDNQWNNRSISTHPTPQTNYDRQRYQKSGISIAQTSNHAKGWFSSQLDGSTDEDDENLIATPQSPSPQMSRGSPSKGIKPVERVPAKSPVRSKASAAMTKMGQLAAGRGGSSGSGFKKEKEFTASRSMSTPEKDKWRNKWRLRFEKLLDHEQREISEEKPHQESDSAKDNEACETAEKRESRSPLQSSMTKL